MNSAFKFVWLLWPLNTIAARAHCCRYLQTQWQVQIGNFCAQRLFHALAKQVDESKGYKWLAITIPTRHQLAISVQHRKASTPCKSQLQKFCSRCSTANAIPVGAYTRLMA
jgi:hypothetical protein